MNVPKQNELHSTAILRVWGRDEVRRCPLTPARGKPPRAQALFDLSMHFGCSVRRRQAQLALLLQSFEKLIDSNATIAECTMEIIEQENVKGVLPGRTSSEAAL